MASSGKNCYFIITTKPASYSWLRPGQICYMEEGQCSQTKKLKKDAIPVICIGKSGLKYELTSDNLTPLSQQQAELLLALSSEKDRLDELKQSDTLNQALDLKKGSDVAVKQKGQWLKGVVRYIGRLVESYTEPIGGVFFGVELQGEDRGKGENDGTYLHKLFFKCEKKCGIFVQFNRIKPALFTPSGFSHAPAIPETPREMLSVGDRVTYFISDETHHGMVLEILNDKVWISTDRDEHGREGGEIEVPLAGIIREEDFNRDGTENMDTSESSEMVKGLGINTEISVNSMVEVLLGKGPVYGTVHWIGRLPGQDEVMAGLELEEECGVGDGKFKNVRYFKCAQKRGLFVKLISCRPDPRFLGETASKGHYENNGHGISTAQLSVVPPIRSEDVTRILIGREKGIQGHCNSCYMDSALFSLFSCSSVLDSLLFKSTKHTDERIQKTLRDIVCPLRSKGFVAANSVMELRQQLQDRGFSPSYTTDEKDPEEFLTLIMQYILSLDPPLRLHTLGTVKEESSYFYQILLDYNNSLVLPTVQQLLEHSLYNNCLRMAEVPSCLILTMPRSGKQFKMFPKIIPSLELDITSLLSTGPKQCVLCGRLACFECTECYGDSVFSNTGFKHFCDTCSAQVHLHPNRRPHKPTSLSLPEGYPHLWGSGGQPLTAPQEKLELFAVLCIETSHYVSFVKHGPKLTDWVFFDSMADRVGESDGYNIPLVKECPEVARYLTMPLAELAKQVPREMEGVAKRLFCDGYMYLYQSPKMGLYH